MAPTSNILRAARPLFRSGAFGAQSRQQAAFRSQRFGQQQSGGSGGRRWQSTADGAAGQQQQSWFKRMWESEVGIKTVHFWYVAAESEGCMAPMANTRCAGHLS